jgi:hypothetical protein
VNLLPRSIHPIAGGLKTVLAERLRGSITSGPLTGISRNAHLYVKTPAGPRGYASMRRPDEHGPMHGICGLEEETYECRPGLRAAGSGTPAG